MDLRVGFVIELARHEIGIGMLVNQSLCFSNRAAHAFGGGCQNQLGAKCAQQHFAFFTHTLRHGNRQFVAAGGAYHGQTDTGIAAGCLYNYGIFVDFSCFFRRLNHRFGDTVFHTAARIEKFQFDGDFGFQSFGQIVQFDQRRVAD